MTKNNQEKHPNPLLRQARTQRGWSQERLARELGVSPVTVNRWECGTAFPYPHYREHLCQLFETSAKELGLLPFDRAAFPLWNIPYRRNAFFTGREEILETLHAQLGTNRAVALTQPSALYGLGGIGKTQIALEYAYQHALDYCAIFWIAAESEEQMVGSLLHIASVLGLPERDDNDQQRIVAAVQRWLSTHDRWLLIWDNVEELELLHCYLPATSSGAVLITTRCQVLGTLAWGLNLLPMEQKEGTLFLLRRAKVLGPHATREQIQQFAERLPAQYAAALELVTMLGGLPLALDQAGAYLEEMRCGLPAYFDLFRTQRDVLLQRRGEGTHDHPASVSATFTLAITAAAERHPAIKDLLQICALLQADAIPEELFCQGGEHLGPTLEAVCRDPLEWNRVVGTACSNSLLSRQPEEQMLSIHRLVQAVLKSMLPEAAQHTWKRRVLQAISHLFPSDEKEQADYWQRCERLLPHALLCLTWSEEKTRRIALMTHVATYFLARSRCAEAEALYLQARHLGEQTPRADHPLVVEILYGLARLYRTQGKYTEAEALYLQAIRLGEQTLGADHPQVSEVLCRLAMFYGDLGKYAEAEPLYQKALSIREQTLGADHPRVATVLQGLAVLYDELGKYAEAEPLYQKALSIREQTLGADHPQVATVLHNLATNYQGQSRDAEAEPLFRRALHIWEQTLGPEHPRVAYPLHSLAEILRDQGRDAEAEPLFRRALHIWEQALGSEDSLVAVVLNSLALLSQKQGRDAEAETLFQRALSIQEQHLDPQHPETAQTLHDLAIFRQKQGRVSEGLALTERALLVRSQLLGDTHPKTVATQTLHAQLLEEQANAQEKVASQSCAEEILDPCSKKSSAERACSPSEKSPLLGFLDACCERHPRAWCRSADLWQAYRQWAEAHQERYLLTRGAFTAQLKVHGCRTSRTNSARIWRGIALVNRNVTERDGE